MGKITNSTFKLTIKPKGKASVPTIIGTYSQSTLGSVVDMEFSTWLQTLLSYALSVWLPIASLFQSNYIASLCLIVFVIAFLKSHHSNLKKYKTKALDLLISELELKLIEPESGA
jgi:hypothetical protein